MLSSLPPWPFERETLETAREELKTRIARFAYRTGDFTLASGLKSDYYIDGKQVTLSPAVALVGLLILDVLKDDQVVAVGGLTIGADPIAAAVSAFSYFTPRPLQAFLVRKEVKDHGTRRRVEGPPLEPGDRVAIVEDVVTQGGSARQAIDAVEALGAKVCRVVVLVDRQQGGREALERDGYPVTPLFTIEEIKQRHRELGL